MNQIKFKVKCPIYFREEVTYCYVHRLRDKTVIIPNGCEFMSGSPLCRECCNNIKKLVADQSEFLDSGDFVINKL